MSIISEYVTPFLEAYHTFIEGSYLRQQLGFKGSRESGGSYNSKVQRYNRRKIQSIYDESLLRVKQPSFDGFFQDNIWRVLCNPFDRLIAAYQAYPSLKARFFKPGTFSHTFTEIMNEGVLFGAFKGVVFNVVQLGFVLYPSVILTNKSKENKFITFLSSYTFFDALFYPIDSLKNILYADTLGSFSLKTVANNLFIRDLYKGFFFKLAFNVPVLSGLYWTTQSGSELEAAASWAAAALLYPLNTFKIRAQVSASGISSISKSTTPIIHSAYRGVVPFLLLNTLIGYSLRPLFSEGKLSEIETEVKQTLKKEGLL